MTLFSGDRSAGSTGGRRPARRGRLGWTLLFLALFGTVLFALLPSPYVIERPGPVFDTLGSVEIGGTQTPMISIPGEKTWPATGALDMLTVSVLGDPDHLPNWLDVAGAWLDPSQAVLPLDSVYPPGYSVEDSNKQGEIDMQNSQKDAVAAALRSLGHKVPAVVTVAELTSTSPSRGILEKGDRVVSVAGAVIDSVTALRKAIAAAGAGTPLKLQVVRDGEPRTVSVTPELSTGAHPTPVVGIYAAVSYEYPFDVKIQLDNVGGPSAGQMFALGIIDKLTEGSLTGGKHVAGTGTIDDQGTIGRIGGIRQKMYGAKRAGATIFFAPRGDCDEVVGHVPDGLKVFAVSTLKESLHDLHVISSGGDIGALRTCAAG
ncbi:YlbL family protein [Parafrigoribacterium soli]|uniref:YlbL family protein n=1 Tax=Parafrigoribacterium soli TaxID=3144663 RepID=UPI0032EAF6D4